MEREDLARLEQQFVGRTITGVAYWLAGGESGIRFALDDGGHLEVRGDLAAITLQLPAATAETTATPPSGDHHITPRTGALAARTRP